MIGQKTSLSATLVVMQHSKTRNKSLEQKWKKRPQKTIHFQENSDFWQTYQLKSWRHHPMFYTGKLSVWIQLGHRINLSHFRFWGKLVAETYCLCLAFHKLLLLVSYYKVHLWQGNIATYCHYNIWGRQTMKQRISRTILALWEKRIFYIWHHI